MHLDSTITTGIRAEMQDQAENAIAGNLTRATSRYVFESPHATSVGDVYVQANKEFLIPTPAVHLDAFPKFNAITGGFRPREYSILCGATGVGKTTLVANWSSSLIQQNVPHFVASVETGHTDYVKRVLSVMAKEDLNSGDAVPLEKMKSIHTQHGHFFQSESMWLSLYENRFSVKKLMNDIAWMVEKKGCKVAIIDNLNFFMEVTRSADQVVEMDRVTHDLIIFCKEIDVHVVMIMHPKKTEHGRVESEFDIKGSSTAVQEAHNVFLFNRPGADLLEQEIAKPFDREIKIAKMRRRGRAVGARVILKSVQGVAYQEGEIV
jgi:replicative DNA helicase